MEIREKEQKSIANFKYWIDTNTERGVCYLPDYICTKVLNLIEKLQKENEELEEINNELEAEKNEAIRRYNFETIPIKKVKDKIEYLEDYIEENSDEQRYCGNINPDVIYGQIEILEEILKLESE